LHAMISTPVFLGDYVYGLDSYGEFRCLDATNGDRVWEDLSAVPKARWSTIHLTQNGERFWMLNVRSSADLDGLVETAQRALKGADPQGLRDNGGLRARMASQLAAVQASLDGLLVDQPRRRVLRPARTEAGL